MSRKTLFFSDVHLKAGLQDRARQTEFVRFLRSFPAEEFERFVCVGDLFDFWFEYRHVIFSGYFEVLRVLAELREQGVGFHLICGNHDFWGGRFLEELGVTVHRAPVTLDVGGQRVHLNHGDGVNPRDHGYRIYKHIARNPLVVRLFRMLHPDWAMSMAQGVSHGSRTMLQKPDPATGSEARALRAYAARVLTEGVADVVICGHAHAPAHVPVETEWGTKLYINTGDWLNSRTHVVYDGEWRVYGADANRLGVLARLEEQPASLGARS